MPPPQGGVKLETEIPHLLVSVPLPGAHVHEHIRESAQNVKHHHGKGPGPSSIR